MCTIQRNILDARRWVSLFLVCCFVLCGLGGIHQRAQAIVGVDDALIGILIAGLAAIGITFVSTGAYNSLTEYVGSLLDEYAGTMGTTGRGLFSGVQTGANSLGQILINNPMVRLISSFATWLKVKFNLSDNSTKTVVSAGASIEGYPTYALPLEFIDQRNGYYYRIDYSHQSGSDTPVCMILDDGSTYSFRFIASGTGTIHATRWQSSSGNTTTHDQILAQTNGTLLYWTTGFWSPSKSTTNIGGRETVPANMWNTIMANATDIEISEGSVDVNTGAINPPLDDTDYDDGDGAIIDVAAPWGMTYPDIVNKWLPKEWAPGMSGNPSMTYDAAPAIDDQVQTGPESAQVSSDPGEYAVPGLQSVFPFCIPFDIYNLLSALAADPVAPSFTWRFYVPRVCDETFTVDLSPFDTVAQIVRTVELLAFIVGLAMVTRERFLRG